MIIPIHGRTVNLSRPVKIGVEGENGVTELVFSGVPVLEESQLVTLAWAGAGGVGDITALEAREDGYALTVPGSMTRMGEPLNAYVEAATDEKIWRSAPFVLYATDLPNVEETVEPTDPTIIRQIQDAIVKANAAASHFPQIGENGNWYCWDTEANAYVDSGVSARGEQGETGGISIDTADVGQMIVVKETDENGRPIRWEAVDIAEAGAVKYIHSAQDEEVDIARLEPGAYVLDGYFRITDSDSSSYSHLSVSRAYATLAASGQERFLGLIDNRGRVLILRIYGNGVWATADYSLEQVLDWSEVTQELGAGSTSGQIPSAKAAYDAIQSAVSGMMPPALGANLQLSSDDSLQPVWRTRLAYSYPGDWDEILPDTELMHMGDAQFLLTEKPIHAPVAGGEYEITWNGQTYVCKAAIYAENGIEGLFMGNQYMMGGELGPEPFTLLLLPDGITEEGMTMYGTAFDLSGNGTETVTVSIRGNVEAVRKMDPKYLPDTALLAEEQTLSTEQRAQARSNIGAAESEEELPDYWKSHADEGVEAINTAMLNAGYHKAAFLFYSDAHWNRGAQMAPKLLKYLYRHTGMAKTFFGGDIVNNEADDYDTMAYLWQWRRQLKGLANHHSVVGNHDDGNTTNNLFSEKYVYGYLLAAEETPDIVRGEAGLYYYIDSPTEKTRYLCLDTAFQSVYYDEAQKAFVKNALLSTPDGWHIVAIAHIWHDTDYTVTPPAPSGLSVSGSYLLGQFDNYNSRAGEYADCGGWVEFCIGGHTHWDFDSTSETGIPVILVETDSWHVRSGLDKTAGTTNESSVNGIIADYDAKKIHVVRIGRGESRDITVSTTLITYTNQLPLSLSLDGSGVFNGIGYKRDTRTSSSGDTAATGWCVTGLIPAKRGDVIRFKNMEYYDISGDGGSTPRTTFFAYDASFAKITNVSHNPDSPPVEGWNAVYGDNGDVIQLTIPSSFASSAMAYMRICCGDLNENSVITVNEEIT